MLIVKFDDKNVIRYRDIESGAVLSLSPLSSNLSLSLLLLRRVVVVGLLVNKFINALHGQFQILFELNDVTYLVLSTSPLKLLAAPGMGFLGGGGGGGDSTTATCVVGTWSTTTAILFFGLVEGSSLMLLLCSI